MADLRRDTGWLGLGGHPAELGSGEADGVVEGEATASSPQVGELVGFERSLQAFAQLVL